MSVPVTMQLTIKSITIDYGTNGLQVNFGLSKFGQPLSATLEQGQDFSLPQMKSLQDQIELLFAKWVSRQ